MSEEVVMPQNTGKKAAKYKLTLEATGAGGSAKGKLTVADGTATAASIAAGGGESCALLTTGRIKCWGSNEYGQLGYGKPGKLKDVPVEVNGVTSATQVSVGGLHACALMGDGHIACWGDGKSGQLGNGIDANEATPVQVMNIADAGEVAAGAATTCALLSTGHVACWGYNQYGELGNGTIGEPQNVPVEVSGITDAIQVSAAGSAMCALVSTGSVFCWGRNAGGRLGDGDPSGGASDVPVEVAGIASALELAGSLSHSCAVLSSGHGMCWGENAHGELGDGTAAGEEGCHGEYGQCSASPVEVVTVSNPSQLTLGGEHTCALLSSGHVECWGGDGYGQLGGGAEANSTGSLTPVEVQGIASAKEIAAGEHHTCALLTTGHIKCWGAGAEGALGNGSEQRGLTPVEVSGI
ncbi:MAG TPA: hypothetical protein VMI13_08685 [Solirubrobacteraceae bacterium]|nr:hypothetical protein [Solirubrobacteraceae bacterium]